MFDFNLLSRQLINVSVVLVILAILVLVVLVLIKTFINTLKINRIKRHGKKLAYFEISVPENDEGKASDAEQMFASLSGMDGIMSVGDRMFGSDSYVSFEILAEYESIRFFAICPEDLMDTVARNINAAYPRAEVTPVKPYDIYQEKGKFAQSRIGLARKEVFIPIKTYEDFSSDTVSALLENMSGVKQGEAVTIQIVVNPIDEKWRISGKRYADSLQKLHNQNDTNNDNYYKQGEDSINGINKKITKIGFGVEIKVISRSTDQIRAGLQLNSVLASMSQFSSPGQNSLQPGSTGGSFKVEYQHRYPHSSLILNTAELATIFHLPNKNTKAPNIQWLMASKGATSKLLPSENGEDFMWLGQAVFRDQHQDVFIKPDDRLRHMYVVGQTGTGKSKLIAGCCLRDIKLGHGTAFIDPHGSDIEWIIERIPPERAKDVIIIDPSDLENPIGMNMMEYEKPAQKTLIINDMLGIFDKLYDLKLTGGPIFEQYMRNAMMLVMSHPESGNTLLEIPRVLSDPAFRELKLQHCELPEVVRFWRDEAMKVEGEASLANLVPYITSKLSTFLYNDFIRPIVIQQKSTINFREAIDSKKIILIKLSKGLVGEINANFLGMIILGKLLMAALSREDVDESQRTPFFLYIDEFQNFLTDSVYFILSEARKYRLSLIIAHQFVNQLVVKGDSRIKDAVFGNVGTRIFMRVGSEDSEFLARDLAPHFTAQDLQNQANGWAYAKLLVDGSYPPPFAMHTWFGNSVNDMIGQPNSDEITKQLVALSATTYGRKRADVEAEISARNSMALPAVAAPAKKNAYANIMPPPDKLAANNQGLLDAFKKKPVQSSQLSSAAQPLTQNSQPTTINSGPQDTPPPAIRLS